MRVEFRVLGPLEVLADEEPLPLGGAKQRALLAILLLNANAVVSSDRLIDELWGGEPPKTAAKSLQVLVSQLRSALEPERSAGEQGGLLLTRAPGYMLRLEPEQLDLERFQWLAREGREALGAGDPQSARQKLNEAFALWRGPPLAEFAYADFAQREISRLEDLRLAALEDRIQADLECGRHAEVIGELERLVAEDPMRERPRAQLMLALYRSGRQAEALEAYGAARRALVDELGIEPGRELKELQAAILEQDPELDLRPPVAERGPGATEREEPEAAAAPSESFVGREPELAEFQAAFSGALAGRTSLFLIAGEPGIGKSRLADEVASLAKAGAARVCWGRCWEAGGAPAYWPWVQALRTYIRDGNDERIREQLAPGAADIAQMLPELHELFPDLPPPPSLDPEGARFRLFDSTASFLRAAGEVQPIVLVLDDLHAADEPSLLLLRFVARSLRDARLVVVGAYRDTETGPDAALSEAVGEVRREPVTRAIRLGGLDVSEVARVIESTASTRAGGELAAAIHRETEGNPLFVGELVRLLAAEGRLEDVAKSPWQSRIPQGVREVIGHRLRHLSRECKSLLAVASVLGREFRLDALEGVGERPRSEVLDLLDEAQRARVVVAHAAAGPGGLRFSHALIRDSLYHDLTTSERLRLHRRAADSLEELYGADRDPHLAELAYHAFEAAPGGDADKATEYARRAGDQAAVLLAYEEAARLYRMGLEALELNPSANETTRCELLLALGEAEARGGDLPTAKEIFVRAAEIARQGAPELLARAALGYGGRWAWFRAGKDRMLIPLLEDALAALPAGDSDLRVMLLVRLAGALRDQPVPERRAALTSEALDIARRLGDPRTLAWAVGGTYSAFSWPRDTEAWLTMAREMLQLADEIGDKEQAFFGHFHAVGSLMVRGDVQAAEAELASMTSLVQELRQPSQLWTISATETMLDLHAGRFDEAEAAMRRTAELGPGAQGLDATYYYVINLQGWALRREQGRLAEVEASLEKYVGEYPDVFIFRCVLASVHSELGRDQRARQELTGLATDGFADVGTEWFFGASLLADVCASVGDVVRAELLYEALSPYADYNVYAHPEVALGSASRPLGLLAATMSRWEAAASHFERALDQNTGMGARPWVAHTQHDYARMLLQRGAADDQERALELLRAAVSGYEGLGMTWWRDHAAAELATISPPGSPRPSPPS